MCRVQYHYWCDSHYESSPHQRPFFFGELPSPELSFPSPDLSPVPSLSSVEFENLKGRNVSSRSSRTIATASLISFCTSSSVHSLAICLFFPTRIVFYCVQQSDLPIGILLICVLSFYCFGFG